MLAEGLDEVLKVIGILADEVKDFMSVNWDDFFVQLKKLNQSDIKTILVKLAEVSIVDFPVLAPYKAVIDLILSLI